ncbi:unnamed protein product [Moneuplotes crassus]|uniref:Mitochondrial import inner membrane translocase subunit n=1 Tax=Euplotes crassus TaxID=5936 RepID=A0AAD1Y4F1_EUPCR|nr:unnamed protein product [Moneuplotes crassus]
MEQPLTDDQLQMMYKMGFPDYVQRMGMKCFKRCVPITKDTTLSEPEQKCIQDCCDSYVQTIETVFEVIKQKNCDRRGY